MAENGVLVRATRELIVAGERFRAAAARPRGQASRGLSALVHLYLDGALTAADLARRLAITTAATAELLDRLQDRALISRNPHPSDRRKLLVELTDQGYAEVGETYDAFTARLQPLVAELSPTQRRDVLGFLRAAANALDDEKVSSR